MADAVHVARLTAIGLDAKVAADVATNKKLLPQLFAALDEASITGSCDKSVGLLIYSLTTKIPSSCVANRAHVARLIGEGKIDSAAKLEGALSYLKTIGGDPPIEADLFRASGVGVVVTESDISSAVAATISEYKDCFMTDRYRGPKGPALAQLRRTIPFADPKRVMEVFESQLEALLGPMTEADKTLPPKAKPAAPKPAAAAAPAAAGAAAADSASSDVVSTRDWKLPHPRENIDSGDGYCNSQEILQRHLKETGGRYITRFPPEPNGYLHIGHAKAMSLDFGIARKNGGDTILRFDDTNPEAESQEYIDSIIDSVHWMGHVPTKITHTSDYFEQMFEFAIKLIKKDKAFICHQTGAEIAESRKNKTPSPWRNRPQEESLKIFMDMRKGKISEGAATLRLKQDYTSPNPNMWDLIAYRIKFCPHPHTGDKWVIYPSYDYSHCIVDSLENITHSLCTLEFQTRHESYMWLLNELELYKPHVWEFSRLNITHFVMSKRKLNQLCTSGIASGWDDPRMPTLNGLRRRGYSAKTLNTFCDVIGVARRGGEVWTSVNVLEQCCRDELDAEAQRRFVVVDPVKVTLTNVASDFMERVMLPNNPRDESAGKRSVALCNTLFLERSDFREDGAEDKDFYGLAPGKTVMLRYAFHITCSAVKKDAAGNVIEILASKVDDVPKKVKGVLHWVSSVSPSVAPRTAQLRMYDLLFKSENPNECEDWVGDLDPRSLEVVHDAVIEESLEAAPVGSRFQFERVAYFVVDKDSKPGHQVFNRIVKMKDSREK